jgi:hypothetical protein
LEKPNDWINRGRERFHLNVGLTCMNSRGDGNRTSDPRGVITKWFLLSAGGILLITGIAKVTSALGGAKVLQEYDPMLGITFRNLMLVAGSTELGVALVCWFGKDRRLNAGLVALLATNFLAYRIGLWLMNWKRPCTCLGNLTDALHISPSTGDLIMKVALAYLLIGSYALFLWFLKKPQVALPAGGDPAPSN